jgi:DNA-binding GntR family transcriptional regulator
LWDVIETVDIPLDKLSRPTLGARAFEQIGAMLVSGQVKPGDRLSLRDLAAALDVSITPVREAVSRLTANGALEVTRNRTVAVPRMTLDGFRDLTRVRIEIEGYAAAEAAKLRDRRSLRAIRSAEAAFSALKDVSAPDRADAVRLNQELHFTIYEAAGSPTLLEIIHGLWLRAGPVLNFDLRENPERLRTGDALRLHAEALAAIESGDAGAARRAIAQDIAAAADFIEQQGRLPPPPAERRDGQASTPASANEDLR